MGGVCKHESKEDKEELEEIVRVKRNICNAMSYTNVDNRIKNLELCEVDCENAEISPKQKEKLLALINGCIIDAKLKPLW